MLDEIMGYISDIWGRLSRLESKNEQRLSVAASTTASKNTNVNNAGGVAIDWNIGADTPGIVGTLFSHSTSVNPTRITINRACTAKIRCNATVTAALADASILTYFRINGATTPRGRGATYIKNTGGHVVDSSHLERLYTFSAGDYIEVICLRNGAAGTVTLFGTVTIFEIEEIFQ